MSTAVSRKEKKVSETKELAQKAREVRVSFQLGGREVSRRKENIIERCEDTW